MLPNNDLSESKPVIKLVANGDLRLSANQVCWPEQEKMEQSLIQAINSFGFDVQRAHDYQPSLSHGFIDSQKSGLNVFRNIDPESPIIVAESVWQYSQHILGGLFTHKGPILTVANWSGTWPGLVGMLNLNGSLTKMGVHYSTLWSENFKDELFLSGLREWLETGNIKHDTSHIKPFSTLKIPHSEDTEGRKFANEFRGHKAIMGVFDEGCMGMHNAIIPDELLNPTGIFKERLSQSALYAATHNVSDDKAQKVLDWIKNKGLKFEFGSDEESELTESQVLTQCKMYIAALRIADEFGCDTIGIQYQQGLKDLLPASDLVEGLLNNVDRPPVTRESSTDVLYDNEALPHFNEVDECAGLDGLLTYKLWKSLGQPPENTLHDLRWGQDYNIDGNNAFVWVFLISGAAPAEHFIDGYGGASSLRQPPMYFKLGGGTLRGISKPGHIVWSRVFVVEGQLCCDLGVAEVVQLPKEETERRWKETTPQWPIMHAVMKGISRDQMMARHKSNHIQVVYCHSEEDAYKCCRIKAAAMDELGLDVHVCGDVPMA